MIIMVPGFLHSHGMHSEVSVACLLRNRRHWSSARQRGPFNWTSVGARLPKSLCRQPDVKGYEITLP